MKKINIIDDVSSICNLPNNVLIRLSYVVNCIIADSICDSLPDKDFEFDIGIGKIYITIEENKAGKSVRYRFIPSKELEDSINNVVKSRRSPLTKSVENSLQNKVFNTYKDLM